MCVCVCVWEHMRVRKSHGCSYRMLWIAWWGCWELNSGLWRVHDLNHWVTFPVLLLYFTWLCSRHENHICCIVHAIFSTSVYQILNWEIKKHLGVLREMAHSEVKSMYCLYPQPHQAQPPVTPAPGEPLVSKGPCTHMDIPTDRHTW